MSIDTESPVLVADAPTDLAARYARAEGLLRHKVKDLVRSPQVAPVWIEDTETFWYRNSTEAGTEFVFVDAEAGIKRPAFDHARLAEALKTVVEMPLDPANLPLPAIELTDGSVRVALEEKLIEVSLDTYTAAVLGKVPAGETASPDGRWSVGLLDHNLYIREVATDEVRQLTTDGVKDCSYGGMNDSCAGLVMQENLGFTLPPLVVWSPDSTRFITHRLDQRAVRLMHLVRSSPVDGGPPRLLSYHYSLPGDEDLATAEYFIFNAAEATVTPVQCEPVEMPFVPHIAYGYVWWNDDSTKIYWLASDRGDRKFELREIDAASGEAPVILEETSQTHVLFGPHHYQRIVRVLSSGDVVLWSERTGWGHLYLHRRDGSVVALTSGDWLVRGLVSVDESARRVVFAASGREPGRDPYLQELYSVSLDGGPITTITSDGLDHDPRPSKSGRFFVDVMSRVDVPAESVLRGRDGQVVMELERADASALYATGWTPAERVAVKSADGVTDIWCAIYKPHGFDPSKSYPVLDEIYGGPQISCAPVRFPQAGGTMVGEWQGAHFAALGFVVVVPDHRGSALRGKAFQDHGRLFGDGEIIADHVAAIKQLASTRPWMDLDRVGIYGESCGGQYSTKAMLTAPEFFKVAVSSSGNHDDRVNHAWWGEKFYGLTEDYDYAAHANISLADRLEGKLFLVHGEMDDNAVPHATMRLVDALIKADKDFELLIVPNAYHPVAVTSAYTIKRRWDYFVRHLAGETPPKYRLAEIPFTVQGR